MSRVRLPHLGHRALLASVAVLAVACSARTQNGETPPASASDAPVITGIEPDTIALGQGAIPTLLIRGRGFAPGGSNAGFPDGRNTVRVGRAAIERVAADAAGETLTFQLPLEYTDSTATGRPSAFMPGQYTVSVITPKGTSNTLTLTMIR